MRRDSELMVLTKAKDLVDYLLLISDKGPKKYRYTLAERMVGTAFDALEALQFANDIRLGGSDEDNNARWKLQRRAVSKLRFLDAICMSAVKCGCILPSQHKQVSARIAECIRLTYGWYASDKKRKEERKVTYT